MKTLNSFEKSIFSQFGEDGIIEEILSRISKIAQIDRWCVEFGALDGIHFSNTYNLIKNKGYKAVLIEGDKKKYRELCRNVPQQEAIKICQFITLKGVSSLDSVLQSTNITKDFDLLSIDVDGCDFHIFEAMEIYEPKIVCIEFNPSIPNEIEFVQPADFSVKQGSSAKSIVKLAIRKGYFLAATTFCNLILVRIDFKDIVAKCEYPTLETLRDDSEYRTFIFFGYDGTLLSNKTKITIPWHRIILHPRQLQIIPSYLRKFGGDYSFPQKIAFTLFVLLRFPGNFSTLFQEKVINKFLMNRRL